MLTFDEIEEKAKEQGLDGLLSQAYDWMIEEEIELLKTLGYTTRESNQKVPVLAEATLTNWITDIIDMKKELKLEDFQRLSPALLYAKAFALLLKV